MSWTLSGTGHLQSEVEERQLAGAIADVLAEFGGDGAQASFYGQFMSGDCSALAGRGQQDAVSTPTASPGEQAVDDLAKNPGPVAGDEPAYADDQSAKSGETSQPAPDGSAGD